jgi:hypothetical protein
MARIISLLLLWLVVSSSHVHSADLELARKEGEVVLYTTMVVSDFEGFH